MPGRFAAPGDEGRRGRVGVTGLLGYEALTDIMSAVVGLVVILFARPMVPRLSLFMHRRALQTFLLGAAFFVFSELIAAFETSFGASGASVLVEDAAEFSVMVCLAVAVYAIYRSEREEVDALRRSATTDDLTTLSNRSFFRRAAARRLVLSSENNLALTCVVLDIDDFKDYNDRFGHEAGDGALRCVAQALLRISRADDLVARYGGEEFVLVMNGGVDEAAVVAERIREEVASRCSTGFDPSIKRDLTVSIGVAPLTIEMKNLEELLDAADMEMYRAKRDGKNRVSVARGA